MSRRADSVTNWPLAATECSGSGANKSVELLASCDADTYPVPVKRANAIDITIFMRMNAVRRWPSTEGRKKHPEKQSSSFCRYA